MACRLRVARRQRLRPEPISLAERAESLRELLGAGASGAITLHLELPPTLWPVQADAGELELALLNLTVNARDAMPSGGSLFLTAENRTLRGGEVDPELKGEFVAVRLRDTGVGIPPDILPRIFEPFFTTKEVSRGTGLGLSQVYGFAQQSGGWVSAESTLGEGTAITLYLPRSQGTPAPPRARSRG